MDGDQWAAARGLAVGKEGEACLDNRSEATADYWQGFKVYYLVNMRQICTSW